MQTSLGFNRISLVLSLLVLAMLPLQVLAHAEHDKARFVATDGKDIGRCDKPLRPCQTIGYAVKQANKGDKVLVAAGHYQLNDEEQLFYLSSELVPVLGGYSRIDHYQLQAPQINRTTLSGVPAEWQDRLLRRGLHTLRDGKASLSAGLQARLAQHQSLSHSQPAQQCVDGKAGNFSCRNIDLVGHVGLADFSSRPNAANDIWGHVDLNTGTEYALIGLTNGTAVVSLATPDAPLEVGTISGTLTSWRDIKVYQYFDNTLRRWQAYAYVSSEGSDGIQIIDLNRLPDAVSLAASYRTVVSSHNVFIGGVDYSTNSQNSPAAPALYLAGQNTQRGAVSTLSLANPTQLSFLWQRGTALAEDYSHDVAMMQIEDSRATSDCRFSPCQVLFDFNEQEVQLWDASVASSPVKLSQFTYDRASYIHSGWSSEDNRFLFVHDELDETSFGINTTLRVYQLDDLRNPVLQHTWKGPSAAIDHNGFVRGNRYYMSNYQRGLTILDITDPAAPTEVAFFDTFLPSDGAAFNGMWGTYPYLPSGLILGSDINSGLYILQDNSLTSAAGSLSFNQASIEVVPGAAAQLSVQRPAGTGAVSVAYQSFAGSAVQDTDFEALSGRLSWAADDNSDKTITLNTLDSGEAGRRTVFVRLFDPQGGATLQAPAMTTVAFGIEPPRPGSLSFVQQNKRVLENKTVQLSVQRLGGQDGDVAVDYVLQTASATVGEDVVAQNGQLNWADGDISDKTFTLELIDDTLDEGDESFTVQLVSVNGSVLGARSVLQITILDNDLNTPPQVNAGDNIQVNAGQMVSLTATGQDAENDSISYQWQQLSGSTVSLQNAASETLSFVAPSNSATLVLQVTATDNRGASSSDDVTVTVVAVPQNNANTNESTGGGSGSPFALLLLALLCCRRQRR
ncbi:choice-of-anchor B family protein [Rheinheimera baltica]|uniref:choice-of-anchor B family protein n=1 Tax=Rheinheimera baltica TaxID=67576 RepID=UPI00273F34C0|nr:choice-of-anchor B family protein [Rheinheimera baltica]MDP5144025.1 choice-of-anchor B family protein [Rheinheimera baltica]